MVKTGSDRAQKFALKYDAYVNMLRAKKLDKISIAKFQDTLLLMVKIQDYIAGLDLPYGKKGQFGDLALQYLFKGTDILADLERFEIPLSYFEDLLGYIPTIINLYEKCVYPRTYIKSELTLEPPSFITLFPETVEKLLFEDLTFELEPENKLISRLMITKVCCHNVVNVLSPFLPMPSVQAEVFPALGLIQHPLVAWYSAIDPDPVINIEENYHNAFKLTPIINIGLVKTP